MITPYYIQQLINFYPGSNESEWSYDINGTDMRNLQIKGAARIFNLLEQYKIALLADEVGMGKTIQSLSVIAALLHEKPNARILILAPRDEIAKNWEKEYQTFVRHHYRYKDNIIKSAIGNEPVIKMVYCSNLYYLTHEVQQGWGQIFLGKISSFSSILSKKDVVSLLNDLGIYGETRLKNKTTKEERNNEVAKLLRKEILNHANENKPYFDLVVIDEAHYFRRKDGESLRVNSAISFFGDPHDESVLPIADKVLLLTATPNHSSSKDISNIVSYFTPKFDGKDYQEILNAICIRRLRRLGNYSLNKYNYRKEIEALSDFKNNPLSETFFALYQHELAKKVNQNKGRSGKGISRMMKYLEGVEFIPFENNVSSDNSDVDNNLSTDFSRGDDSEILLSISKKYHDIFSSNPNHPKYDKLVDDLTTKHSDEKALVFVRRIPSVFEIAKRVLLNYDKKMWGILEDGELGKLDYSKLDRKSFNNLVKYAGVTTDGDNEDIEEEIRGENEEKSNIPSSKVLNLFKIIKNDAVVRTDAANFRLRFNASKPGIYGLFFSPASDYFDKPYDNLVSHRFVVGKKNLENYFTSAFKHRSDLIDDVIVSKDLQSNFMPKQPIDSGELKEYKIETILSVFWDIFLHDEDIPLKRRTALEEIYKSFDPYEKEAFSAFLEKGTLLASEAIVWMYRVFRSIKEDEAGQFEHYIKFIAEVKRILPTKRLYLQIQESIQHFKSIYTKVFGINNNKALLDYNWDSFNNAQPIYPYNADNSNKGVLNAFNTPFFPDILVATSVLQEGVNLQYFCKNIYHYGMAWTPGDNEQRIGRVDRMFGEIEREINEDRNSFLPIYYPYLKDTVDEEHLAKFMKRKYKEESLIDMGKAFKENSDFSLEENDHDNWRDFLRKEPKSESISDPYPVNSSDFVNIKSILYEPVNIDLTPIYHSIMNAIGEHVEYKSQMHFIEQDQKFKIIVDPTLSNKRKQPVVIDTVFDPIGTGLFGEAVYCIRMKTPIAPITKLKHFRSTFYNDTDIQKLYSPGIKLCLDITQSGGSLWGIYFSYELPLFLKELNKNSLSVEEVKNAFVNLVECADFTEQRIFMEQDLKLESLNLPISAARKTDTHKLRSASSDFIPKWKKNGNYYIIDHKYWSDVTDIFKQSLIDNHLHLYVKTKMKNQDWFIEISHINYDTQEIEISLLEEHFKIVKNGSGW